MLESGWLFTGLVALCATGVALSTKTRLAGLMPNDDGIAIFSGIVGFISWGMWSYGTLDVTIVTESGTVISQSMPALTYFGVMLALIPGYIALTGPVDIINRARQPDAKDL